MNYECGTMAVPAVPGAGKTFIVTNLVAKLLEENKNEKGKTSGFANTVGKAGADFKRQFTYDTYMEFIKEAGYENVEYSLVEGKIPCAIAVITK